MRKMYSKLGWKNQPMQMREISRGRNKECAVNNILKSFLVAVFCVVRCILYPGTVICIASKTRKQAEEILEKIQNDLMAKAKNNNLRSEIKEINIGQRDSSIEFHNSSRIFVATANENARHFRANLLVNTCAC